MKDTKIEWADDTVNPWWGCERISPACAHCYAETFSKRLGKDLWGPGSERMIRVDKAIAELEAIARRGGKDGRPRRVFIASMADVFEDRVDLAEPRKRLWDALHRLDGRLVPMLLTKRPIHMAAWAKEHGWPAGAWAGTTVEDQRRADERIPKLLQVPARVRFLSCESLLGPVDLDKLWCHNCGTDEHVSFEPPAQPWCGECDSEVGSAGWLDPCADARQAGVNWIIVGGESGAKARPMHPAWARSLRDQATAAGVPFLFKQWGEWAPGEEVEANGTDRPGMYEDDRRDGGVPKHYWPDAPIRATAERLGRPVPVHEIAGDTVVLRVGKHAAGRLFEGRTWDEVPTP